MCTRSYILIARTLNQCPERVEQPRSFLCPDAILMSSTKSHEHVSYSLNSSKGGLYIGNYIGEHYIGYQGGILGVEAIAHVFMAPVQPLKAAQDLINMFFARPPCYKHHNISWPSWFLGRNEGIQSP